MSRAPLVAALLRALLLAPVAGSLPVAALEVADTESAEPATSSSRELGNDRTELESYRQAIRDLESVQGAYAGALPEQLLSLGISLQQAGEHAEAVKVLKRGVHLARINDGLYSPQQIALLQREIASHVALGQYDVADERQHYMYRVQMRSMEKGLTRAQAFIDQAEWQYNAYQLNLEGPGYPRLMSMWDLYRLALNDIISREGDTSPTLLEPLEGMLLAQYLIGLHPIDQGSYGGPEGLNAQQQANRFNAYRAQNYKKGQAVIQAMYDVQVANHGKNTRESAAALVLLGDWNLWQGQRDTAMAAYQQAVTELVAAGTAQEDIDAFFAQPVALPNVRGARALPPAVEPGDNTLEVAFTVNETGKVSDMERVDDNDVSNGLANRVMRKLRKTQFRPQLAMGEPVVTENVTRAYVID
jgi:hypothetical protein